MSKADNERVLAVLEKLDARLEALEQKVDALAPLGTFASRIPVLAEAAGDTATWAWDTAEGRGIDPIARAQAGIELAERLSEPRAMAAIGGLLDRVDALESASAALDEVPPDQLRALATQAAALSGPLAKLLQAPEFRKLVDATSTSAALGVAEQATTALVDTHAAPAKGVGPFAAFMMMGDPDVKRAVGFTLEIAKRFGQTLGR